MDSIVLLLRLRKLLVVVVVVVVVVLEGSSALVVEVPSGRAKCLTEELRRGALSVGRYRVARNSPANLTVSARVRASIHRRNKNYTKQLCCSVFSPKTL